MRPTEKEEIIQSRPRDFPQIHLAGSFAHVRQIQPTPLSRMRFSTNLDILLEVSFQISSTSLPLELFILIVFCSCDVWKDRQAVPTDPASHGRRSPHNTPTGCQLTFLALVQLQGVSYVVRPMLWLDCCTVYRIDCCVKLRSVTTSFPVIHPVTCLD